MCLLSSAAQADQMQEAKTALLMGNLPQAVQLFEQAAQAGDERAQYQVGQMYLSGHGVPADRVKGLAWLERAADAGNVRAQYLLGVSLWEEDNAKGLHWLQQAAASGHEQAGKRLQQIEQSHLPVATGGQDDTVAVWWRESVNCRVDALAGLLQEGVAVDLRDEHDRTALHYLVACEGDEGAALLLDNGAKSGPVDEYGVQPVVTALQRDNFAVVERLVAAGVDPGLTLRNGDTLLHRAVQTGAERSLVVLLQAGAPVDALDAQGYTALDRAALLHDEAREQKLRRAGAVHGKLWNSRFATALGGMQHLEGEAQDVHWQAAVQATLQNQVEILRELRQEPPGLPLERRDKKGMSLLLLAARAEAIDSAEFLLDSGVAPDQQSSEGVTALMLAARQGNVPLTKLLLQRNARVIIGEPVNNDAVLFALQGGADEVAMLLLESVVAGDAVASGKYLRAAIAGDNQRSTAWLLPRLRLVDEVDDAGRSVLWMASMRCNTHIVKQLLARDARTDLANNEGLTALHAAAAADCGDVVMALVNADARKNALTQAGNSPLMMAFAKGCSRSAAILVRAGADVTLPDTRGDTALLRAVRSDCGELVDQLLEAGADPYRRNQLGESALGLAQSQSPGIAQRLQARRGLALPLFD